MDVNSALSEKVVDVLIDAFPGLPELLAPARPPQPRLKTLKESVPRKSRSLFSVTLWWRMKGAFSESEKMKY